MTQPDLEQQVGLEQDPATVAGISFASLIIAVLLVFAFAWISEEVVEKATITFDETIRNYVHQFASPSLTVVMRALSIIGGQVLSVGAIVAPVWLWLSGNRRAAGWMTLTMFGALVLDLALKYAFHRARPVPFFGAVPHTYSFPSGHSFFSFCFYGTLAGLLSARTDSYFLKALCWILAALLIFSIGLSRVYLGVHYPTDVLAGFVGAGVWVSTVITLDRWRRRRRHT
jgi:undecaprenyl-diphosphatase